MTLRFQQLLLGLFARGPFASHTILRGVSWIFLGNVLYAACQWGVTVSLARAGDAKTLGVFSLGLAMTAPVMMLMSLNLRVLFVTDAANDFRWSEYAVLRLLTTTAAIFVIVVLAFSREGSTSSAFSVVLIGLAKSADALTDLCLAMFQRREEMRRVALAQIANGISSLALLTLLLQLGGTILWAAIGYAVGSLLTLLLTLKWLSSDLTIERFIPWLYSRRPHVTQLRSGLSKHASECFRLTKMALPMGFVLFSISLNLNVPRYFLNDQAGAEALGVYAALSYILIAGTTITSAVANAASPRLAKHFARAEKVEFGRLLIAMTAAGATIGVLSTISVIFFGETFLDLAYGHEFADYGPELLVLIIGGSATYIGAFVGTGVTTMRCIRPQAGIHILKLGMNLLLCSILIPRMGIMGACITLLATETLSTTVFSVLAIHRFRRLGSDPVSAINQLKAESAL